MDEKQRTILIVDDTPEDRATCRRYLQQDPEWNYTFLEAESGERALLLQADARPDCVLLDYGLPDMSGLEVLEALANRQGEVGYPVVMLTGANEVELAVAAMKAGAQDFINKGRLTPLDLQRAVHNAVERVALHRELRETQTFVQGIIETAPTLLYIYDLVEQRNVYISPQIITMFGLSPEEIHQTGSRLFADLFHPDDLPRIAAHHSCIREATEDRVFEIEYRMKRADGQWRWLHSRDSIYRRGKDGRPTQILGAAEDMTARKQTEQERERLLIKEQRLRETAEAHNRAKDDFLSVVSHELRSPLNTILGYTHLTRLSAHDAVQVKHNCEIVQRAAKTQQQLIEDLLDTARIINGKLRLEIAPCDLRLVLAEAIEAVRPATDAKDITLIAEIGFAPQQVTGDAVRLQQIVWNLLQNAVKFTPNGGHIELRLERRKDEGGRMTDEKNKLYPSSLIPHPSEYLCLTVRDTGKGIPPEYLPSVFDRFSQQDASLSRRHGGLGLGLALVKQLVELHGGTIVAASDGEGQGATFSVTLPLQAPQFEVPQPVRAIAEEIQMGADALPMIDLPSLAGVNVLAVDDQEEARNLITAALRDFGATVTAVGSGTEAHAFLANSSQDASPDVLLLDLSMPDEDGYSVLRRVRALEEARGVPPKECIPVIAMTAHTSREDRIATLAAGFRMHIGKPIELAELVQVIASVTNSKRKGAQVIG